MILRSFAVATMNTSNCLNKTSKHIQGQKTKENSHKQL